MPDWQEILSRDGPAAWRTAYRLLGNRADADECFQEACLAALEVSLREVVHNWRGLLQRLAAARSVDRLRARHRARSRMSLFPCDQLHDDSPSPPQNAEEAELAGELRTALAQIPPSQAAAFCLHCLEDWSYQEIAQQLNVTIDSVGVLVHRARQRLRELLAQFHEFPPAASAKASSITEAGAGPSSLREEPS
jgi:RNA polymerase sigma-70 factor (ECF subfamily)